MDSLFAEECISSRERQHINDQSSEYKKSELLLDIFTKRSYGDFVKFSHCLEEREQACIAYVLTQDEDVFTVSKRSQYLM